MIIDEELLGELPLTAKIVALETQRDPVLSIVYQITKEGWPSSSKCLNNDLQQYFVRRTELTVEQGCVLWGNRVVIPNSFRPALLLDLHSVHAGTIRMNIFGGQK